MSRQGCCRVVCYAGHCLMCLQLFCPSPARPIYVLFKKKIFWKWLFPNRFSLLQPGMWPTNTEPLATGWPLLSEAVEKQKDCVCFHSNPTPNHPSVSILFSWLTFKATSVSGFPHSSPRLHLKPCSTSSLSLGLPKIQVLRCWGPTC